MVTLQSNKFILYETQSGKITLDVTINGETVWLNVDQLCTLFGRDRSVIQRHIKNIYDEQEVENSATCADFAQVQEEGKRQITRQVPHYNLDVIISLGYRVKSKQGTQFRIWANQVIKDYIIQGYAQNKKRLEQLGKALQIMQRVQDKRQARQVLDVIQRYESALSMLDDYDHQRIAAAIFLHYLDMNNALLRGSEKRIADDTLVALIIMLAESKPQEKQTMVNLVMQFLSPWVSGKQAD